MKHGDVTTIQITHTAGFDHLPVHPDLLRFQEGTVKKNCLCDCLLAGTVVEIFSVYLQNIS
jgi:hypothetical protein